MFSRDSVPSYRPRANILGLTAMGEAYVTKFIVVVASSAPEVTRLYTGVLRAAYGGKD